MERSTGNTVLDLIFREDDKAAQYIARVAVRDKFSDNQKLHSAGTPVSSCFFPVEGALAAVTRIDGIGVNTLAVGFDGAIHADAGAPSQTTPHDVVARLPGQMWRIQADDWQFLLDFSPAVRRITASYGNFLISYVQQSLACERKHDVEARLCRCLLNLYRWQHQKPLSITHLGLSQLLSVRRTTVTLLAHSLQKAGIISCRRGFTEIIDAYALRQASCDCGNIRHHWADLCEDGQVAREGNGFAVHPA